MTAVPETDAWGLQVAAVRKLVPGAVCCSHMSHGAYGDRHVHTADASVPCGPHTSPCILAPCQEEAAAWYMKSWWIGSLSGMRPRQSGQALSAPPATVSSPARSGPGGAGQRRRACRLRPPVRKLATAPP